MRRVRFRKWWKEIKVFSLLAGIVLIVSYEVILTSLCIDIPNLSKFSITSGFYSVHRLFDNSEAMGAFTIRRQLFSILYNGKVNICSL